MGVRLSGRRAWECIEATRTRRPSCDDGNACGGRVMNARPECSPEQVSTIDRNPALFDSGEFCWVRRCRRSMHDASGRVPSVEDDPGAGRLDALPASSSRAAHHRGLLLCSEIS